MRKHFLLVLLLVVSVLPLFPLLHPGLPISHDGKDHVARIANFTASLLEGNIVPRWAANLNWGYGHPILMFLYPLPSYLASIFRLSGFSFIDSTKLVFATSYILSGLSMFVWLKLFLKKEAAFFGAVLYLFAPYRFIDLYVRGALGEDVVFIFPPLVAYFLYRVLRKKELISLPFCGLAIAGLILSHNAISIMVLPFLGLYALLLIKDEKQKFKQLLLTAIAFVLGFALSAFFWVPALFEGKYTLRDIVSLHDYTNRLYPVQKFIYSSWNFGQTGQFSLMVGIVQLIVVVIAVVLLVIARKRLHLETRGLLVITLLYFAITLFLMLPPSLFIWNHFSLLQKFQFPWRFLTMSVFTSAIIGALLANMVSRSYAYAGSIIAVLLTVSYWKVPGYLIKPDSFFSGLYAGTTDTGESSPIWSIRFMEAFPESHVEVIGGKASVVEKKRTTTEHDYVVTADDQATLRENTVYFPGWKVISDNKELPIQFQDPNNRGVIAFTLQKGVHSVRVVFTDTKIRTLSGLLSLMSLFITAILGILNKRLWKRFQ